MCAAECTTGDGGRILYTVRGASRVDLYSAVSESVSERIHEIGIRMAIGATAAGVVRLIFGEGARLMLGGSIVGLGLALALNRLLSSYLFGITPSGPTTLTAAWDCFWWWQQPRCGFPCTAQRKWTRSLP